MRAVLFDLDGTLMDHDAARDAAIAAQLPEHGALAQERGVLRIEGLRELAAAVAA